MFQLRQKLLDWIKKLNSIPFIRITLNLQIELKKKNRQLKNMRRALWYFYLPFPSLPRSEVVLKTARVGPWSLVLREQSRPYSIIIVEFCSNLSEGYLRDRGKKLVCFTSLGTSPGQRDSKHCSLTLASRKTIYICLEQKIMVKMYNRSLRTGQKSQKRIFQGNESILKQSYVLRNLESPPCRASMLRKHLKRP